MSSSIQHLKTIINTLINERRLISKSNCDNILKLLIQNKEELYSLKENYEENYLKIEKIKNNVYNIKQTLLNETPNTTRKN
jgi:hypothetical protein